MSAAGGELSAGPMPEGLPAAGRVVAAAGRLPSPVWLLFESPKDDGKGHENPLFRLGKEGWKKYADDWKPAIAAWSKHRILAASTSSGKLKIKVIEPSLATAPADLPSPHVADASCEKTLRVEAMAALSTGEVFAAGTCKPETGAGTGRRASRYVGDPLAPARGRSTRGGAPSGGRAGRMRGASAADAGTEAAGGAAGRGGRDARGCRRRSSTRALYARGPGDVWAAARGTGAARAGVAAVPLRRRDVGAGGARLGARRVCAGSRRRRTGTPWMATARAVLRRDAAPARGSEVPPPERGFEDGAGTWEMLGIAAPDGRDVWIAARRTSAAGERDLVLRTRPAADVVRWE